MQNKKKDELEARASVAEQKIHELKFKVEDVRTVFISSLFQGLFFYICFSIYLIVFYNCPLLFSFSLPVKTFS